VHAMENISRAFEWVAVGELVLAFVVALARVARDILSRATWRAAYTRWRAIFGRGILVSVEILVAADLIRTVAVQPTLENVAVLGLIVVVRILLSFSLDIEIDGVLPWRKGQPSAHDDGP
jgi:uncharacterized membrane protein